MSTLVELFTPFRQALDPEIDRIAAINFEDFIADVDMLTVVYYASHPSLWYLTSMKLPVTDFRREAAEKAKDLHCHPEQIPALVKTGFFSKQLRKLLECAKRTPDYGAKLAQVFLCMIEHREEHHLSEHFVREMWTYLEGKGYADGFLIKEQPFGEIVLSLFIKTR